MAETRRPTLIAINHDDHHAEHVGRTADGRQFFLTTPFVPGSLDDDDDDDDDDGSGGCEFVARYLFDADGRLLDAAIESFGPRATLDQAALDECYERLLRELGSVTFERIEIAPFSVERFGTEFGLLLSGPEDDDDQWWATFEPGDYMAFAEPWDSGDYDT